jgi:DNA repair protein RecN (Recombination protein N)
MLTRLTIQNYALIRHLEMVPSPRLTVITGETGAGKSIMLGAIGLLLGNRADTKVLWDEETKCVTEGQFDIADYPLRPLFESLDLDYSEQTILRREISPGGKSRAFINDTPVTLDVMRAVGSRLMDVHSQHETLELGTHRFQLELIDSYAANQEVKSAYEKTWKEYRDAKEKFDALTAEAGQLKAEYDFIRFQLTELQKAAFQPGEQEQLESDLKVGEHAEDIKTRLSQIVNLLGDSDASASAVLAQATGLLQPIQEFSPALKQLADRLQQVRIELKDILREAEHEAEGTEIDPARTRQAQERLDVLYTLFQKHRLADIPSLLSLQEKLEQQARKTTNLDEELLAAGRRHEAAQQALLASAKKLRDSRTSIFPALCKELTALLKPLGIPQASLEVQHTAVAPGPGGADQVEILFSANKGIPPRPLEAVASGGEFSRLMFCVKYVLAEKRALPTLVLDEIDTGVSGEIAIQLGAMMKKMARKHQIVTITHLPQMAAKGDAHFLVFKDTASRKASTGIRALDEGERIEEIAKMIGGAAPSPLAKENARELLGV